MKPPAIEDKLFDELMTDDHSLIISRFHKVYGQFRDYFNDPMSCLADIQQIRKKCGKTPKSVDTIFPSELTPEWDGGHAWYAYHYGGRLRPNSILPWKLIKMFQIGSELD